MSQRGFRVQASESKGIQSTGERVKGGFRVQVSESKRIQSTGERVKGDSEYR